MTRLQVLSVAPLFEVDQDPVVVTSEDEAVAVAKSRVGPNVTQVTISTIDGGADTFAVRHVTWRDGGLHDGGWRAWLNGRFIGEANPQSLLRPAS